MTKAAVPIADRSIAVLSTDAGKSYIVFGKTDNTAINLSAIANGTGGCVIDSERGWILADRSIDVLWVLPKIT
jgi:hypothetical protein